MDPISLATSRGGPPLVMLLCRMLPCLVIGCLGRWLSAYLSRRGDVAFVRALRANLAVVHGLPEEHPRVHRAAASLLENTIVSYADLFRMAQSGNGEGRVVCELLGEQRRPKAGRDLLVTGFAALAGRVHPPLAQRMVDATSGLVAVDESRPGWRFLAVRGLALAVPMWFTVDRTMVGLPAR